MLICFTFQNQDAKVSTETETKPVEETAKQEAVNAEKLSGNSVSHDKQDISEAKEKTSEENPSDEPAELAVKSDMSEAKKPLEENHTTEPVREESTEVAVESQSNEPVKQDSFEAEGKPSSGESERNDTVNLKEGPEEAEKPTQSSETGSSEESVEAEGQSSSGGSETERDDTINLKYGPEEHEKPTESSGTGSSEESSKAGKTSEEAKDEPSEAQKSEIPVEETTTTEAVPPPETTTEEVNEVGKAAAERQKTENSTEDVTARPKDKSNQAVAEAEEASKGNVSQ